ncbi:PREDICTED: intracellular hyaluronan-binding protein 4, partial [Acanthisitta chloris]|uniref:intracellular hyaluronan-binding protein 4 n=1 Tax=Acanthisitta chloris TaxID=57068 RepID=UPI0004F0D6E6
WAQEPRWREHRGAEAKQEKTKGRPYFRKYHYYETQRQVEFMEERNKILTSYLLFIPTERSDREGPIRGCGGGRGRMRGRGRGGVFRSFDAFQGRRGFGRQSDNDKSGTRQTAPVEETEETAEQPGRSKRGPLNKVAEGQPVEEVVQEMTLDEWKNLQQQNRPKAEFNIRKPESTVPPKAVVIHESKYRNNLQKGVEGDSHVFRRPANDITRQLNINFGSLSHCDRGSRRGQVVCGNPAEGAELRPKVQPAAPNPDDLEDFPALA